MGAVPMLPFFGFDDPMTLAVLFAAKPVVQIFLNPLTGSAADRFGGLWLSVIGLLLMSAANVAFAHLSSFGALLLCRLIMGVGSSMLAPSVYALINTFFADNQYRRDAGMG